MPEPANAVAPPLNAATANGPAALVVAPVVPAGEHIADSAADGGRIEITREERDALTTLISRAAMAAGFKGRGYIRAWLHTHYKIDVSDIAGIPPEIRARSCTRTERA